MKCKYCDGKVKEQKKSKFKSKLSPAKYKFYVCVQCGAHFSVARAGRAGDGVKLIFKRAIEWKGSPPAEFPCFVEGCEREAGVKVCYRKGVMTVNVVLCEECARLSVGEIAGFFGD